jgi:hypothetical protein
MFASLKSSAVYEIWRALRLEENANLSSSPRLYTTFGDKYSATNHQQQAISNGYPASILKKRGQDGEGQFEAKNDEVIRRVAEMKQILQVTTQNWLHTSKPYLSVLIFSIDLILYLKTVFLWAFLNFFILLNVC